MLSREFIRTVSPKAKVLNIIWGAFLAACVIYVFIAWIMFSQTGRAVETGTEPAELPAFLPLVFAVFAIGALGASLVVERIMLAPTRLKDRIRQVPTAAAVLATNRNPLGQPSAEQVRLFEGLSDEEKRLVGLVEPFQTAHIVIWAMREGIVILGLVLAILQASFTAVLPFAAVGFVALLLKVPRLMPFYERNFDLVRRIN
ncbi:MAG: hypothetical protein AB7V45_13380 [Candidatus Krumholzibacteriia bacterium]